MILALILLSLVLITLFVQYRLPLPIFAISLLSLGVFILKASPDEYVFLGDVFLLFGVIAGALAIPVLRQAVFTKQIFRRTKQSNARVSTLEKQALAAGEAGFETGYFTGTPDWKSIYDLPKNTLSENELAYINGPIADFCEQVDDWDIRSHRRIPQTIWDLAETYTFSGLRVGKKWGGANFSFQAQSLILSKVASRSVDASVLIELPVSLYPDEIIEEHGTKSQKEYYLPRLAAGKEIVSFAVTGAQGSDIGNMPDTGIVSEGMHEGKKVLGVKLTFSKRYISFAPKASLVVLAFSLKDPDGLLPNDQKSGITLALIPTNHPGIDTSKRHYPAGLAFPHGPISGTDVFIPLEWIIGAEKGIGLGWKMIVQCLFVGRCLALPSISVGTIKTAFRTTTAYAAVRRQFGLSIKTFEGVQGALSQLTDLTYRAEAARSVAAALVDSGKRPLAVSGIMKYQLTEYARQAGNYAFDIHAGKAICDGPSNYLLSAYNAVPIGVTVEGANIVTRSVITFAQGALQSHPYLRTEIESCEDTDLHKGLITFDTAFTQHLGLFFRNSLRSVFHNSSFGMLAHSPSGVQKSVRHWHRQISRYSTSFAVLSDCTILLMGTTLKKKQRLGGRLSDILSELYILSSVLKRYQDDGYPPTDYPIVQQAMEIGLHRIETDLKAAIKNFPLRPLRPFLRFIIFPLGAWRTSVSDNLANKVAHLVIEPSSVRDRLSEHSFVSNNKEDNIHQLETALTLAAAAEPIYKKIRAATRAGIILKQAQQVNEALEKSVITAEEASVVREAEAAAAKAVAVDAFEQDIYRSSSQT